MLRHGAREALCSWLVLRTKRSGSGMAGVCWEHGHSSMLGRKLEKDSDHNMMFLHR